MKKFTTDGFTVTRGEGYMGIYSTVGFLNDRMSDIDKLKKQVEVYEKLIVDFCDGYKDEFDLVEVCNEIQAVDDEFRT